MEDNYTFSFECGKRLAIIKSKSSGNNGKIIHLYDKKKKCCNNCSVEKCKKKCCDNCCKTYHKEKEQDNITTHIKLNDDEYFEELPTNEPNQTNIVMISAKAGAGKSYYLKQYIQNYKKIYKDNKVYLMSESNTDKLLDELVKRIPLDKFVESELEWNDIPDHSLLAFDDIDCLENTKENGFLKKKLYHLMNSSIQNARKKNISIVQTVHCATDGQTTKVMLLSCSSFVFFLNSVSVQHKNALNKYLGISKENIKKILEMKGRWVCIYNMTPMVVMGEREIYILGSN
jgi:ribosome-binding factor A